MSLQIKTLNLVEQEAMSDRDVELNGKHVQSVNLYQTDGSFITVEPFNNKLIWYPQNPNNVDNTFLGEWKEFTSFAGYGFLSLPMDAKFDYVRRILWIADAGNKRVLKVEVDTGTVLDVVENGYFCHSIAVNVNTGGIFVKSIKDANNGIIQHYNQSVELQGSFEFPCYYSNIGEPIVETYAFMFSLPLPSSMVFDHVRNRLWWIGNDKIYMADITNKNIVPYSTEGSYYRAKGIDVDFASGNTFITVQRTGYNSWYILQMFRDNNSIVSTAYLEKLRDSNRPHGV